MILVDSCVWIDLLRGAPTPAVRRLQAVQAAGTPEVCISSVIYFEVLRGITADGVRQRVQRQFDALERRDFTSGGFDRLVTLSHYAGRLGVTLPKLGDWLIVKTVLDHSLTLLTSDRDFYRLQRVVEFPLDL